MDGRRLIFVAALAGLASCLCLAQVKLAEDPPLVKQPTSGPVAGTVAPAGQVAAVTAVLRAGGKTYKPARFDKATGEFTFQNLPGDATYDLCIKTSDGREIEGIDLDYNDSRLMELAEQRRTQLGVAADEPHEFVDEDVKGLLAFVAKLEDFMEIRRPLYVHGHGRYATMLIELMRTRDFYESKGKFIWRVELWYFEYRHGEWERVANVERVLRRERVDPEAWKKIDLTFYPELSVKVAADGTSPAVKFTIPDKPDPARGRAANTRPELESKPRVFGSDGREMKLPAPSTTSAPTAT